MSELTSTAANGRAPTRAGPIVRRRRRQRVQRDRRQRGGEGELREVEESRIGECPRVSTSTTAGPTTCAITRSCGAASSSPSTSGSSESDSECALPRTCAWTTNSSVAAKRGRERPPRDRARPSRRARRSRTTWCHNTIAATASRRSVLASVTRSVVRVGDPRMLQPAAARPAPAGPAAARPLCAARRRTSSLSAQRAGQRAAIEDRAGAQRWRTEAASGTGSGERPRQVHAAGAVGGRAAPAGRPRRRPAAP